ncbi:asparaginase [Huintestinicola sp.]|uniref:asparaginase n=1 Tax=Huintestinicola sp. TaxID=2981661 RepID=UPI003D7DD81C
MKKIKWFATGGTISCVPTENGLSPAAAEEQMRDMLTNIPETGAKIFPECIINIDSSDISCEDIRKIGLSAYKAIQDGFDGIIITHGTDTMAYTSAMLRKMLVSPPVPVIITGAQRPFYSDNSDGKANLFNSLNAALNSSLNDVYLLFGDKLIRGDLAHKEYTHSDNAFISSREYAGIIKDGALLLNDIPHNSGEYSFNDDFDENVMLIKLTPGTDISIFSYAVDRGVRGIVIEGYGTGGIPHRLLDGIAYAAGKGIKIMLISQCLHEGVDMSIYEVGVSAARLGVMSGGEMTAEAAVAEMMFMLGKERCS